MYVCTIFVRIHIHRFLYIDIRTYVQYCRHILSSAHTYMCMTTALEEYTYFIECMHACTHIRTYNGKEDSTLLEDRLMGGCQGMYHCGWRYIILFTKLEETLKGSFAAFISKECAKRQ